jgi:N-methylhydantoinase B
VVSAQYPATVGASPVSVGSQTLQAMMSAMSKAMPGRAITSWAMRNGHYIFGIDPRTKERYVTTTFDMDGGTGAVSGFDGHEGPCGMGSLGTVNKGNVEELEMRFPWKYKRWEFLTDSAGDGRWRGGSGMHWEVENQGGEAGIATGSSDGELVNGPGALGGEPTRNNRGLLIRDGEQSVVRGHRLYQLKTGDRIRKLTGGGAAVGNPAERDPEAVLWDVLNEYVSVEKARSVYKVAVDRAARKILWDETRTLRGGSA